MLYGTFKLAQRMPGGDKMVGFTRILHRTAHDGLSPVVPTWRANPLHPGAAGGRQAAERGCPCTCYSPCAALSVALHCPVLL